MTYIPREITIVVTGGPSSGPLAGPNPARFGPNQSNTLTLAGYRVSAQVEWAGSTSQVAASIVVYGMALSDMNALASIGPTQIYASNNNMVSILAGDANSGMSLIFQGVLQTAVIDFNQAPQVAFIMSAVTGYGLAMNPIPPSSFAGAANVAEIMSGFALQGNMAFENNGVNVVLSNPYFPGTLLDQIKACARHANINYTIDPTTGQIGAHIGTLAIWPKNGYRKGTPASVGPTTGMVGYPSYSVYGVDVTMQFNPTLLYAGQLNVQSSLAPANKTWVIYGLNHSIESITPNGDWFTQVSCFSPQLYGAIA